jgi:dTDP-4-amino-4,6-dideoxygalactose transaminase
MKKLALLGGHPTFKKKISPYNGIGKAEIDAVCRVAQSGNLSGYYGTWRKEFFGGPCVQEFENNWKEVFKVKHALSVNSATSGLIAALGAIGLSPGDEVIVPPWTMSATVMAPLFYGGIPIFVDIEDDTFCLDFEKVKSAITPQTKVIYAVNLFGHPAPLKKLKALADSKGIYLLEDNAQAPLAMENKKFAGTIGHIGIFSLNYHKHIHTGEGGMCVTDDDDLAQRISLIRNHGENVVEHLKIENISNLIGFNFRMTELSAAVGIEQLKSIDLHLNRRIQVAESLNNAVKDIPGSSAPVTREDCSHVYYVWAMKYDPDIWGVPRSVFSKALEAEGFPHFKGYGLPLYKLPVFQRKIAIGNKGFPFNQSSVDYQKTNCPVVEKLENEILLGFEPCAYNFSEEDLKSLVACLYKVYENRDELRVFKEASECQK